MSVAVCTVALVGLSVHCKFEENIFQLLPETGDEAYRVTFTNLKLKDKIFVQAVAADSSALPSSEELAAALDLFMDGVTEATEKRQSVLHTMSYIDPMMLMDAADYAAAHFPAYLDMDEAAWDSLCTTDHIRRQIVTYSDFLDTDIGENFYDVIAYDPCGMVWNVFSDFLVTQRSEDDLAPNAGEDDRTPNAGEDDRAPNAGEDDRAPRSTSRFMNNHLYSADGMVCYGFVTPAFGTDNSREASRLVGTMESVRDDVRKQYPDIDILFHGTIVLAGGNSKRMHTDIFVTVGIALLVILLLLIFCLKRPSYILLTVSALGMGVLLALAGLVVIQGGMSLMSLGIGAIVLGVAFSYVLHVLTHQKYVGDAERMLRDQVKPVWLGCLTTIGSFAGLIFIQTDLLQDFGLFAAFAILGTTLFSLTYLPQFFRKDKGTPSVHSFAWIDRINTYPFDRKKPLLIVIFIVMVVCVGAYVVGGTRFDADMHNLGYEAELTEHSETVLREKTYTGDKTKYFASKGRTMEEAISAFALLDKKLDSLQQLGLVKSYTHTNQIFVPLKVQQERINAWKAYWTKERLAQVRQLIAQTAPQAGLTADAFDTFFEVAEGDYKPDALYAAKLIPAGYQSTLMEESYDGNFLCFTSVRCANDSVRSSESDYMRICDAIAQRPELLVLDTYYYTTDTLLRMSEDFDVLQWLSMAFVFVVLLLSFHFNLKHTVLGFLPILLSWLIVLGAMVLFDIRFNLISIIISTFIFGIGVDYSIFVMDGLTHQDAQKLTFHKTAIFLSAVTLITTVSSMLIASHPAIRSVGFSTLVGLLSAVILSYVLQPAIYRWINRKNEK